MRVGFFGGSFDPPHRGHLAVALASARASSLDRVLLAPAAQQPLKREGASAPFADRLAMVELLCQGSPRLEASTLDAPLPGDAPNFTIDTLARLRAQLDPVDSIYMIVGADAFLTLRRWRAPTELLAAAEWIAVSRPGFTLQQLDALRLSAAEHARVQVLEDVHEPVTATGIRDCLREGGDCAALLPAAILAYIRAHHLYGT